NINLDLIFGIPTQTLESFKISIQEAISLEPQHLSIYGLALEESTQLAKNIQMGLVPEIDDDLAAEMYEWVMKALPAAGFEQYEISNWAIVDNSVDYRCVLNIQYWRNEDYLGIGAGAHSYVGNRRWRNVNLIPNYLSGMNNHNKSIEFGHNAILECNQLEKIDIIKETMMMGLRLTDEGVNLKQFRDRFSVEIEALYTAQINKLCSFRLLEYAVYQGSKVLRLTKKGRALGNQVFLEFV
ncbi:MAG: hypothetical protein Q7J07_06730, partial [Pelolinea sp.]|nr:hypothetical protein [Pelolinea sp.]